MRRRGLGRVGRPSLVGTAARTAVIAGTATAVSGRVAAGQHAAPQQEAQAQQQAAQQAAAQVPVESSAPAAAGGGSSAVISDEVVEQLKKLAELRDAGILTEEEFAAKKSQLLGI